MAKRKSANAKRRPRPRPDAASAVSQDKLQKLRKYYELGWRANDRNPDGTSKTPEPLKALADEVGLKSTDTIRLALKFATTYSRKEFEELLSLRGRDGEPLGWYLVRVLLQIKDRALRAELQRRAAEEGGTRQDLWDEINARESPTRRRPRGGRKFALPRSAPQALRRLVERCDSWLRFYENVGGEGGLAFQVRSASGSHEQAAGLKELVRQARVRLREVEEAARKVADQLQKMEPRLKGPVTGGTKPTANSAGDGKPRGGSTSGPAR